MGLGTRFLKSRLNSFAKAPLDARLNTLGYSLKIGYQIITGTRFKIITRLIDTSDSNRDATIQSNLNVLSILPHPPTYPKDKKSFEGYIRLSAKSQTGAVLTVSGSPTTVKIEKITNNTLDYMGTIETEYNLTGIAWQSYYDPAGEIATNPSYDQTANLAKPQLNPITITIELLDGNQNPIHRIVNNQTQSSFIKKSFAMNSLTTWYPATHRIRGSYIYLNTGASRNYPTQTYNLGVQNQIESFLTAYEVRGSSFPISISIVDPDLGDTNFRRILREDYTSHALPFQSVNPLISSDYLHSIFSDERADYGVNSYNKFFEFSPSEIDLIESSPGSILGYGPIIFGPIIPLYFAPYPDFFAGHYYLDERKWYTTDSNVNNGITTITEIRTKTTPIATAAISRFNILLANLNSLTQDIASSLGTPVDSITVNYNGIQDL